MTPVAAAAPGGATPGQRWASAGRTDDRRLAAAPALAVAEQRRLARHPSPDVRRVLARNPSLDVSVQSMLADDEDVVAHLLARNPAIAPEILARMARHGGARQRAGAAMNPRLGLDLQQEMLGTLADQLSVLAANRGLLPRIQQRLAASAEPSVRRALAANPSAEPIRLARLARDHEPAVRASAARNPGIRLQDQDRLASDPAVHVRLSLAGNHALHPAIQLFFAADESVRERLAGNPALTRGVAAELLADPHPAVRAVLAGNPSIPAPIQESLARDVDGVRDALARNWSLASHVQCLLASTGTVPTRLALAGNRELAAPARMVLAQDASPLVREELLHHPRLQRPELRVLLARSIAEHRRRPSRRAETEALGDRAGWTPADLDHPIRGPILALLAGAPEIVSAAAAHPDALVRLGVLGNPDAPALAAAALLDDRDPGIRDAAKHRWLLALAGR